MSGLPPLVNGVSPCEGPPGTKIKIWGENLGVGVSDVVSVLICGHECVEWVEWLTPSKLVCQAGEGYGKGPIIVTTSSGGEGTCSVFFTGTAPPEKKTVRYLDPMMVSEVWVDEEWNMFEFGAAAQHGDGPSGFSQDPMGFMDQRRGQQRRLSQENIRQLCPEGSGKLLAENFNPVMYLLEHHCGTSFQELCNGCHNLRSEVERSRQTPGQFIKEHLDEFVQCYDTLSDVNELLIRNESESEGGSITDKVEHLLQGATKDAKTLFEGVLHSKVKADTARNALAVLQRYRFLFNLPRSIEKNIRNREYDIVTNDYERAKSLFAGTQVKVFAKVMQEVENHVSRLRTDLKKQLLHNPSTFEEQKRLIKYLLDLEYPGDPAWECIVQMHQWTLDLMFNCKKKFQPTEASPEIQELPEGSAAGRTHTRTPSNISQSSGGGSSAHSHSVRGTGSILVKMMHDGEHRSTDHGKPKRIQFVEELIDQFSKTLPSLWRLGQAYFNKAIITTMLIEQQEEVISENMASKQDEFDLMVMEITETYTDMVNAALFKDALEHLPEERVAKLGEWVSFTDDLTETCGAWLPLCVRRIRACLRALQDINLSENPLYLIQQLSVNVRTLCADTLFFGTAKDIEVLHEREDWKVQAEEGSVITSLPVLFENIVVQVLITLREIVVENHPGEKLEHSQPLLESSVSYFYGLLEDFIRCLEWLSSEETEDDGRPKELSEGDGIGVSDDTLHKPSQEEKLLLILSNSSYTRSHVAPQLFDCFMGSGYPECKKEENEFQEQLVDLDKQVFQKYIELKLVHLDRLVTPGMHAGYFNWLTTTPPVSVRNYITDVLLYLVHVHSEVYAVSADMTKRVLLELVEQVSSKMYTELQEIGNFSEQGALYAFVELRILQETLLTHMSEVSQRNFKLAMGLLGVLYDPPEAGKISEEFHRKTKLQFMCFYNHTGAPPQLPTSAVPPKLPPKRR